MWNLKQKKQTKQNNIIETKIKLMIAKGKGAGKMAEKRKSEHSQ